MKALAIFAATTVALTGSAQTTQRLAATKANDYAIVYTLPTTTLKIVLECELTLRQPGEFYKYAKRYLNVEPKVTSEERTARLVSATVYTVGQQNPEERYSVTFKSGSAPYMLLSSNGLPLSLNTEQTVQMKLPELPEPRQAAPTPLQTPAARQVISQEMLQSQSSAKRAELAAQAIFDIRQTRSDLLSGQADQMPPDGKSLQLMLDNLEAQEQALLAMFVGTESTWTDVATFSYTPQDAADGEPEPVHTILARISALDGFVAPDDLSGAPVYLDLSVASHGELPLNDKGVQLPFPKNGIAYRIPGELDVAVTYDGRDFYHATLPTAQYGAVYGINPALITDRKAPIALRFDPATGALLYQGPAD